jgi:hypothetical protein
MAFFLILFFFEKVSLLVEESGREEFGRVEQVASVGDNRQRLVYEVVDVKARKELLDALSYVQKVRHSFSVLISIFCF